MSLVKIFQNSTTLPRFVCKAEPHWTRFIKVYAVLAFAIIYIIANEFNLMQADRDQIVFQRVALIIGLISCVVYIVYKKLLERFEVLGVTEKSIVKRSGIINIDQRELPLSGALAIQISLPISGRILGFGSVVLQYEGENWAVANRIRNPVEFHRAVTRLLPDKPDGSE